MLFKVNFYSQFVNEKGHAIIYCQPTSITNFGMEYGIGKVSEHYCVVGVDDFFMCAYAKCMMFL